jgi:hypothetical protein
LFDVFRLTLAILVNETGLNLDSSLLTFTTFTV